MAEDARLWLHWPEGARWLRVAVVPAFSIPVPDLDLLVCRALLCLGVHVEQRPLLGFPKFPNTWGDWYLAERDWVLHLAPSLARSVWLQDIPEHVALAADRTVACEGRKHKEHYGKREQDSDDLVMTVHATGEKHHDERLASYGQRER